MLILILRASKFLHKPSWFSYYTPTIVEKIVISQSLQEYLTLIYTHILLHLTCLLYYLRVGGLTCEFLLDRTLIRRTTCEQLTVVHAKNFLWMRGLLSDNKKISKLLIVACLRLEFLQIFLHDVRLHTIMKGIRDNWLVGWNVARSWLLIVIETVIVERRYSVILVLLNIGSQIILVVMLLWNAWIKSDFIYPFVFLSLFGTFLSILVGSKLLLFLKLLGTLFFDRLIFPLYLIWGCLYNHKRA